MSNAVSVAADLLRREVDIVSIDPYNGIAVTRAHRILGTPHNEKMPHPTHAKSPCGTWSHAEWTIDGARVVQYAYRRVRALVEGRVEWTEIEGPR